ncbi:hypothetical protein AXF42_Ash012410 [Apostasia shenzhenica]|uniref:Uncharacterized protein n=1 Tax=Apostasia shenzhenica TaxID=1088818 RepID=A0A2I0AQP2_9ASPA|nr:hypothetical protein AXF42_Ash012410 [Apostasia shenzhenica]
MAASRFLMASIALALVILGAGANAGIEELEGLRARISALETGISDRDNEIKRKDESILELENFVKEKAATIASLLLELESFQKKADLEEAEGEAQKQASEFEKQVTWLKSEVEAQNKKKDVLEARIDEAEKKAKELNIKLETLQRAFDEQKLRIKNIEHALKVAEEELMKAQLEVTSKSKKLTEVHEAWVPPWLTVHMSHFQEIAADHWNKHGKSSLAVIFQKVSDKSVHIQKWAEPHLRTAQTKWIPVAKEKIVSFPSAAEPFAHVVYKRTIEVYEASKETIKLHIAKAHEVADPFFQEAKKFSKPYIDQLTNKAKPHVEKVQVVTDPYRERAAQAYKKLVKTIVTYHNQVQVRVRENLKNHDLTDSLATRELTWFLASSILAFPVLFLFRLLSAIFYNKNRQGQKTISRKAPKNHKRKHADN